MTRPSERELRQTIDSLDDSSDDAESLTVTIRRDAVDTDGNVIETEQHTVELGGADA
jgi:hypothetical protein